MAITPQPFRPPCAIKWRANGKIYALVVLEHIPAHVMRKHLGISVPKVSGNYACHVTLTDDGALYAVNQYKMDYQTYEREVARVVERFEVINERVLNAREGG